MENWQHINVANVGGSGTFTAPRSSACDDKRRRGTHLKQKDGGEDGPKRVAKGGSDFVSGLFEPRNFDDSNACSRWQRIESMDQGQRQTNSCRASMRNEDTTLHVTTEM